MNSAIQVENPDLVVITGDLVSGAFSNGDSQFFAKNYLKVRTVFDNIMRIPCAWIPGPGDLEAPDGNYA